MDVSISTETTAGGFISGAWLPHSRGIYDAIATAYSRLISRSSSGGHDDVLPSPNRIGSPLPPRPLQTTGKSIRYLLSCMQTGDRGNGRRLHQELVPELSDDKRLFQFVRYAYYSTRKLGARFTLRDVAEIGHCKVRVAFEMMFAELRLTKSCRR